jgi:DNA end-binding protein Ku
VARPIWTGALMFGLVTVPVALYAATESHGVSFRQIQRGTSDRVRNRRVNERTGEEVAFQDIVKGYDLGDEQYVILDPKELDDIAPGKSRSMAVKAFVALDEVDPIYLDSTYYLAPRGEEFVGVYALLIEAMEESGRVAITSFVMRGKEYLAAVRPAGGVLQLHTLHYADEVRDPAEELPDLPERTDVDPQQLAAAKQLIEALTKEWQPDEYHDAFRERVEELIDAKRKGNEVVGAEAAPDSTNVLDLMGALRRSLDEQQRSISGEAVPADRGVDREDAVVQPIRSGPTRDELEQLTKHELYEKATEAGVAGRSKMTREQLIGALVAGGKRRRTSAA